jgi:serine protease Do
MVQNRSSLFLALTFLGSGVLLGLLLQYVPPGQVLGQALAQPGAPPAEIVSRQQEYAQLDRDAEHLVLQSQVLRRVVRLSGPFVVHIDAQKSENPRSPRSRLVEEAGSGILIEHQDGFYVLTNRHVVKDAANEQILIKLDDGRELNPSLVRSDADTDIAVMSIQAPDLVSARLGDSDCVEIGDFVLAVGSPFGLSRSVTYGIVSAKGRRDLELGGEIVRYQDFLQTDAAINPGNSGGPLLNLRGEVIGMNTAIASSSGGNEGIGFSIPINMVLIVARQLIEKGEVSRAFLGVNLDARFTAAAAAKTGLSRPRGARVTAITPGSPAEQARLAVGDVILEFDRIAVENDAHLINMVSLTPVGTEVPISVFRGGQTIKLTVKVGERAKFEERR